MCAGLAFLRLMKAYMPTVGTRGLDMMFRTCTIQVNLDFDSEQDMIDKFRIGLALQPIAVAIFANSPFVEGRPSGQLSTRGKCCCKVGQRGCVGCIAARRRLVRERECGFAGRTWNGCQGLMAISC